LDNIRLAGSYGLVKGRESFRCSPRSSTIPSPVEEYLALLVKSQLNSLAERSASSACQRYKTNRLQSHCQRITLTKQNIFRGLGVRGRTCGFRRFFGAARHQSPPRAPESALLALRKRSPGVRYPDSMMAGAFRATDSKPLGSRGVQLKMCKSALRQAIGQGFSHSQQTQGVR
jgi:hypothetical protein